MRIVPDRTATSDDADAIGAVHVAFWRETYAGLLLTETLRDHSVADRSAMWRDVLADPGSDMAVVVAESGGLIVGFGACGQQRDQHLCERGFRGEIGALYVLRAYQHRGVGRALMSIMARHLLNRGLNGLTLWVLRANAPARSFYEALGGIAVAEREGETPGGTMAEVAYSWHDPAILLCG